jgi:hypothetical protein
MLSLVLLAVISMASAQDASDGGAYGRMSDERVVFEIPQGEIEFGFFPELAPVTTAHIFELCTLGLYTGKCRYLSLCLMSASDHLAYFHNTCREPYLSCR